MARQDNTTKNHLVAVVVSYNRLKQIKQTIDRLVDEPCSAIVVVDNGSHDGSREWLCAHGSDKLKVILSKCNLGGAGGFEIGIKAAVDTYNPNWVVVMDDDARPEIGAFSKFTQVVANGWGMLAAAVYLPDGNICEMNRPSRNPFWNPAVLLKTIARTMIGQGRKGFHISDESYLASDIQAVDAASFVGMFISREVIADIGLPEGKMFIYGDDVAYSLRARKAGYKIGFAPSVRFQHACNTFEGKKTYMPLWKVYYNYRNGMITYKEVSGLFFPLVAPVYLLKWALNGRHYGPSRKIFYKLLWKAVLDGFRGRLTMDHGVLLEQVDGMVAKRDAALEKKVLNRL